MPAPAATRITFLVDSMSTGGTELNALRVAERLVASGEFLISVLHLHATGPLLRRYKDSGIDTHHLLREPSPEHCRLWTASRRARTFIAGWQPHVLHSHDIYSNVVLGAALFPRRQARALVSRRWLGTSFPPLLKVANGAATIVADHVVANSTVVAAAASRFTCLSPRHVSVVPNFVEQEAFLPPSQDWVRQFRTRHGVNSSTPILGVVARLDAVKNHLRLLEALSLLRGGGLDLTLVIMGEGPMRPRIEARVRDLKLADRVHLVGEVPNRPNPYFLVDIGVLVSRSEGFPNSLLEAMAAARPIVATAVGGVTGLMTHGETGLLVPTERPKDIADAIALLVAHPGVAMALGHQAAVVAADRYAEDKVISQWSNLYRSLRL